MVIVGAGAIGLSCAIALARRRAHVVVIEAGSPGSGTTGTTYAWVNANDKPPTHYQSLNQAGLDAYHRLAEAESPSWLHLTGHLKWTDSDEAQVLLEAKDERLRESGYRVERLSPDEVTKRLEPDLRLPSGRPISYYPDEGFIETDGFIADRVARARAAGVELMLGQPVVAFELRGGTVRLAVLADGTRIEGGTFVLATGRWTSEVAGLAGANVPMMDPLSGPRTLGLLAYTAPVRARLERVVSSPGLGMRPNGGRRLILQGPDLSAVPESLEPDGLIARQLLERGGRLLRGLDGASFESIRVGYRAIPVDGLTIAGWAPDVPSLYVVATHSGMTLALVLGELVAREVEEGQNQPALELFRPTRFAA